MTATDSPEYRTLQRETSDDIIRHDARRGDGEYATARRYARSAGSGRRRMAELASAAGEFVRAASDWLSAAACFLLAGDGAAMAECVGRARALADAGRVPADQRHVRAALAEREAELRDLLAATPAGVPAPAADPTMQPQP